MNCDNCQMLSINGTACHEVGCPKQGASKCVACETSLTKSQVWHANDWDGIDLCRGCAEEQARYEAEEECQHDERDHGICLDCGDEEDPGEAIDRAQDALEALEDT